MRNNSLCGESALNTPTAFATQSRHIGRRAAEADTRCRRIYSALVASAGFAAFLLGPAPALAVAIAPDLGAAQSYTVLGRNSTPIPGTVTCTTSTITGDVGSTANSITNTGCTIASIVAPVPASVTNAFDTAYSALNTQNSTCDTTQSGTLAGVTLAPGVHCFTAGAALTGLLTLNGPPNGIWVFRIGTSGTGSLAATNFQVQMAGGGQACNVYWETAGAATLTTSDFIGTILSGSTVTLTNGTFTGRALATTDATVTTVGGTVAFAACSNPTVTVTKVSNGGVGPFSFTGTNGFAPQTITTVTSGTGVSGATQTLTTAGVSTTITESAPPAGFTLASIACSGFGSGGTATPDIVTRTVTLDAAATATGAIACTFTNTFAAPPPVLPTVTVTKVSNGGVGAFSFTGTNGFAPQTITTVTSGAGVSGATQTLAAAGVSTTITESAPPAGFTLASITCSGLGAGGTATPNIATRTVTLDAAATAAGAAVACTFSNTFTAGAGPVPTLSEWAMVMLAALLAIAGFAAMRRQAR
jgi:Ice-binding-like/IPTL-CTERM motif